VGHVLLQKAQETFAAADARAERIVSLDDRVFLKAKVGRWRGAVWRDLPAQWLCAAGRREDGSPDDFYERLSERGRAWRGAYNGAHSRPLATDTYSDPLLPAELDRRRLLLEEAEARVRALETGIPRLVAAALRAAGSEQRASLGGFAIGVYIERRGMDEIYVGVRIDGPVRTHDYAVILDEVPGTDPAGWQLDRMPHRGAHPGELVWSTIMDAAAAEALLAGV